MNKNTKNRIAILIILTGLLVGAPYAYSIKYQDMTKLNITSEDSKETTINSMLDRITNITLYSYYLSNTGEQIFSYFDGELPPELQSIELNPMADGTYMDVDFASLDAYVIGAIQGLNEKIEALEAENVDIKARLDALEKGPVGGPPFPVTEETQEPVGFWSKVWNWLKNLL